MTEERKHWSDGMTPEQVNEFLLRALRLGSMFGAESFEDMEWLNLRTDGEYAPVTLWIRCNDLFWWGTSDMEELTPANIHLAEKAARDAKNATLKSVDDRGFQTEFGVIYAPSLAACYMRNMRPQGACYRHWPEVMWPLFDAAGPERTDTDGAASRLRPEKK